MPRKQHSANIAVAKKKVQKFMVVLLPVTKFSTEPMENRRKPIEIHFDVMKRCSKIPEKYVYAISISAQYTQKEAIGFNISSSP